MNGSNLVKYWSNLILDELLRYRNNHPEFTFALRQVNRLGRLNAGHWFQGDENYIFVGFTARGDENNKTRSVGLVFTDFTESSAHARVEVIFRTESIGDLVSMYRHIIAQDADYYKPNQPYYDGYKYFKDYGVGNPIEHLETFLQTDWPVFVKEAKNRKLEDVFLVHPKDFEQHLKRVESIKKGWGLENIDESKQIEEEEAIEQIDESGILDNSDGQDISYPFDASKIDIRGITLSLDLLVKRLKRKQINLHPAYQRLPSLWKPAQMSRLIESLMIRLPLPVFYFDGSNETWEVVDGLQRLSTLQRFMIDEGENALRLTGLEYLVEYNGKTFAELPPFLQSRIEETQLMVYVINPGTPDEIKYNIFKRINTGGLILTPQEIRNALNQGVPAETVREMADYEEFKRATSYKIPTERMEDCDFVTRYIGFYEDYTKYQPDLDSWLNKGLARINKMTSEQLVQMKSDFKMAMNTMYEVFGEDAFRKRYKEYDRRKPINKALFDTWSINISKRTPNEIKTLMSRKEFLKEGFIELMNQEEFDIAVSRSTGDMGSVRRRFEKIRDLIEMTLK